MATTVRIGLLGCGRIAQMFHLRVLRKLENAQLTALADASPDLLKQAQVAAGGVAGYATYDQLLAEAPVDAVVIALPTHLHGPAAIAAFSHGKHVYVEKPLAASLDEAAAVVNAWRASGKVGMMGFNFRFHPVYQRAREWIAAEKIGAVLGGRSVFCAAGRNIPEWKKKRATGGGVLLDLASHHIDLSRFVLNDEVDAVAATVRSYRSEHDTAAIQLRMRSGAAVQLFHSMAATNTDRYELQGDSGALLIDRYAGRLDLVSPQIASGKVARIKEAASAAAEGIWRAVSPPSEPSFALSLAAFARAAAGEPVSIDLTHGRRNLAIIAAAERAAESGRFETVEEPTD